MRSENWRFDSAQLLRDDGYQGKPLSGLTKVALAECGVLVVANAVAKVNVGDRAFPHPPALDKDETEMIVGWLSDGGALLLIADHAPYPGAVADLGLVLGINMLDRNQVVCCLHRRKHREDQTDKCDGG